MKLAVLSDSHGNLDFVEKVLQAILAQQVDLIIHLGDNFVDAEPLMKAGYPCIRVPGTWCPAYEDPIIENRKIEALEQWRFLLSHTPSIDKQDLAGDLDPERCMQTGKADIFLHGHTHKPECVPCQKGWRLNPGHLKAPQDRGYPASYALIELHDKMAHVQIIELLNQQVRVDMELHKQ